MLHHVSEFQRRLASTGAPVLIFILVSVTHVHTTDATYNACRHCTKFSTNVSTVTHAVNLDHVRRPILNSLTILVADW